MRPQSPVDGVYRSQRARLRSTVAALTAGMWATGVHTEPQTIRDVLRVVHAGQAQTVALVDAFMAIKTGTQPKGLDASQYTVEAIRGVAPEELYRRPWGALGGQMAEGAKLADAMGSARASLARLVTTDLQLSQTYSARDWMTSDGSVTGYERVAGGSACALCEAASQGVYHSEDLMPIHEHCVVGETLVASAVLGERAERRSLASGHRPIREITRRWYRGEIIRIRTAAGNELTVTPNHPVLTSQGWVAAGRLSEGDYVLSGDLPQRVIRRVPHEDEAPVRIEDRFAAARMRGLVSVPFASEDFHGDGGNGKVDVVTTNGELRYGHQAGGREPCEHLAFAIRAEPSVSLAGERGSAEFPFGAGASAHSSMSGGGASLAFFRRQRSHSYSCRVALVPAVDPDLFENARDCGTVDSESSSEGHGALAGQVASHNFTPHLGDDLACADLDSARSQMASQRFAVDPSGARALTDCLAGCVEADRIIDLGRHGFSGHVYNLHTADGFYTASRIVTHNCSCDVVPVIGGDHSPSSLDVRVVDEPGFGPRLLADDWAG